MYSVSTHRDSTAANPSIQTTPVRTGDVVPGGTCTWPLWPLEIVLVDAHRGEQPRARQETADVS